MAFHLFVRNPQQGRDQLRKPAYGPFFRQKVDKGFDYSEGKR